jgi:TRAP-type C4-dicarboxylate transport system permease small subunit
MLRYLVLWSGLLGGAVATKQGKHIRIDLASHLLPPGLQAWLQVLLDLAAALVCVVLTRVAIVFVRNEAEFGSATTLLAIPGWVLYLIFPLAFGLMSGRFLLASVTAFRTALNRAGGREPAAAPPTIAP